MAFGRPFRTINLTRDNPVLTGPVIYHGGFMINTAAAAQVDVWDGIAASGQRIDQFRTDATILIDRRVFESGIFMSRGIFLDFSASLVTEFTLYYDVDIPEALGGPRAGP